MEIRRGSQLIENGTKQAIVEFVFTDYIIYVFQGTVESISDIATGYAISWVVSTVLYVIIGVPCLTYRVKKCGRCNS